MENQMNAGVDWLTVTTRNDDQGARWYQLLKQTVSDNGIGALGNTIPWKGLGYYGVEANDYAISIKWGYSDNNGYIMIAGGGTAAKIWRKIVLPPITKTTRLDLAVTVKSSTETPLIVADEYENVTDFQSKRGRPLKVAKIENNSGGSTLYIGSRQSQQMGRLYDKGAQSRVAPPRFIWRYEVELKKPRSDYFVTQIYDRWSDGEEQATDIIKYVGKWFTDRGCSKVLFDHRAYASDGIGYLVPEIAITTPERKLAWFREQVAPSVRQLIEAGLRKEVLDALDLQDAV